MGYRLIDYNGKLAATLGWATNWTEPQRERRVLVSSIPVEQYSGIVGSTISDLNSNVGKIWRLDTNHPLWIDLTDWTEVLEVEPVRKPRKSKNYDSEWLSGKWHKFYR